MSRLRVILIIIWTLSTLLFTSTPPATTAAPPPTTTTPASTTTPPTTVTPITSIGGFLLDATVADGYAYLGEGSSLTVLDLADPQNPTLVARLPLDRAIRALTIVDTIAYITTWDRFITVDISTPTRPVRLASIPTGVFVTHQIAVQDGVAYVAADGDGLLIIDVAQPRAPVMVNQWEVDGHSVAALAIAHPTAYLALDAAGPAIDDPRGGVHIVDIRQPTQPTSLHVHPLPDEATTIAVQDQMVYVGYGLFPAFVQVLDLAIPTAPDVRQNLPVDFVDALAVSATQVAVTSERGITLGDRAADGTIQVRATIDTTHYATVLVFDQGWLYAGGNRGTLQFSIINVQPRAAPELVHTVTLPGQADVLAVRDTTVYYGGTGLQRIDVQRPQHPQLQGTYTPMSSIEALSVDAESAYLATYAGLEIVDLRDPVQLTRQAHVPWTITPYAMTQIANTLYIGYGRGPDEGQGLMAMDVTNPTAPRQIADLPLAGRVVTLQSTADALYGVIRVADGPTQLVVIDPHTTPLAQVTTVDLDPDARTLTQQGPYLYVGGRNIAVLDIRNPTIPRPMTSSANTNLILDLTASSTALYGIVRETGLVRIPLIEGQPQPPVVVYPGQIDSTTLQVMGPRLFVGQRDAGMQIYQIVQVTDSVYLPLLQR